MRKSERLYSRALSLSRCLQLQGGWLCSLTMNDVDGDEIKFSDWEVLEIIKKNKKLVQFLRKHGFDTTISRSTLSDALENDKKEGRVVLTRSFTVSTRSSNEALQLKAYTKDHQDELNKIVEVYGLQQQKLLPLFCAECNRPMNFFLMLLAEAQERKKLPIRQEKIRSFEIRENLIKSLESKESESVTFKECLDCKYFVPC